MTPSQNLDQKVRDEIARYEALFNYDGPGRIVDWREYMEKKRLELASIQPFLTGIAEFDYFVDGFVPGELVVLTGLMANGKTLFTKTLVNKLGEQGYPICIFSYEDYAVRYLEAFEKENKALDLCLPDENTSGSFKWLEDRIIEAKVKRCVNFVVIDHLHYIVNMKADKLHQDIGVVMRRLKILACEQKVVIFIVCHQKGLPDSKTEPSLYTCRDSSAIPQECDTGITVHRIPDPSYFEQAARFGRRKTANAPEPEPSYDQGYCFVKIDKARRKGTYRKKMTFQKRGDWLEAI